MNNSQIELELEHKRLEQTISLANKQLNQAKLQNEDNKSSIVSLREEMREGGAHSISNLCNSQNFDDLVELSQFSNSVTEKINDFETIASKIAVLERVIKSPYFARIDFKFDDEDTFENIYIGRSSLKEDNSYEIVVYDWRSPIASVFYRFGIGKTCYEAPSGMITGEVNLKRQYEIEKGALQYYFDADVEIIDEFLRKMLSHNTSSKMKTIVETIQKEQDSVIRDMENDLMMVQGVAGSGKTSIALHRAAYLMYQGLSSKLSANNIIIISPNSLFEQYISNVLPELGEDNIDSVVFEEILDRILPDRQIETRNQFLERLITNTKDREIQKKSMEFKTSDQFLNILERLICDLPHRWIRFDDVYYNKTCIVSKETLKKRIQSGSQEIPLGVRLKYLEEFVLELLHESKKGPIYESEEFFVIRDVQKFTVLNIENIYRNLFRNKNYFYKLAKGFDLPDCIEEIIAFTRKNLKDSYLCYDDATVLAYLNIKISGDREYKNIKQVVIDEAQDYYPLQYEIFKLLFSNSQYTILGDMNQTLEKQEDISLYEQISKILNKKKSSLVIMDKSFRCTTEILNFSSKFIEQSAEIKSFNRKGDAPEIHAAPDQLSFNKMLISEVNTCLKKGYQSIGLICKTERNAISLFKRLNSSLDVQLVKNEDTVDLSGVFIIPVYMSKGLEFDAVLICDVDTENYHSEDDKKLLYIACTRALHRLNLFCKGELSALV